MTSLGFDASVDYYQILGVARGASPDEVKRAYRELARENHPDSTGGDRLKEERFKRVSQAYEVIGDAALRRRYDEVRDLSAARASSRGGPSYPFDLGAIGDLFAQMFDPDFGFGGEANRGASRAQAAGDSSGTSQKKASRSSGAGKPRAARAARAARTRSGATAEVDAPVADSRRAPAPSMVAASDGSPLLAVGSDVESEIRIPFHLAIAGTSAPISTLDGEVRVVVPPGTSSGRRLRLRGRGLHAPGGRGDHYVTIQIGVPDDLDEQERAALAHFVGLLESRGWR